MAALFTGQAHRRGQVQEPKEQSSCQRDRQIKNAERRRFGLCVCATFRQFRRCDRVAMTRQM